MEYIVSDDKDEVLFDEYQKALKGFRHQLPKEVAEFAADRDRYVLNDPGSLHDAWVESIVIKESRRVDEVPSEVSIVIRLLGQMHDRYLLLSYQAVSGYSLTGEVGDFKYSDTFHGDIFTHEVRVSEAGNVIHEILAVTGSTFLVECETFTIEEELI